MGIRWTGPEEALNYDTMAISVAAVMFLGLVPTARSYRLVVFLCDLTSIQALVMRWAPLVSASFLFIWACNWLGALVPWPLIEVPSGELAAPTNDINVTTLLALCAAHGYAFAGFDEYRGRYPVKYLKPVAFLLPINVRSMQYSTSGYLRVVQLSSSWHPDTRLSVRSVHEWYPGAGLAGISNLGGCLPRRVHGGAW